MKYHLVNTDLRYVPEGHDYMLKEKRVAAFFDRADEVDEIARGDVVFLYQNKVGVVGAATGKLEIGPREWDGELYEDAAHSQRLNRFRSVKPAIEARTVSAICANFGKMKKGVFLRTRFELPPRVGKALYGLALAITD